MNGKYLEGNCCGLIEALYQYFPEETEEDQEKPKSG
jgi:hypothetical protein